jgi:hypothetical protein
MTDRIDVQLEDGARMQINLEEVKKIHENRKKKNLPDEYERELVAAATDAVG